MSIIRTIFPLIFSKSRPTQVSYELFTIPLSHLLAQIFYPINNTNVGQGLLNHVVIHSKAQTNLTFPFTINYQTYLDPQYQILQDLAQKCGVVGTKSNISVQYKITVSGDWARNDKY